MVRNVISWLARGGDRSLDRKPGGVPCARVGSILLLIGFMLLIGARQALAMPQGALPSDEARATEHVETSVEAVDSTSGEAEGVREYRVSIGPFSRTIVVSESFDLLDLADRARGVVGIFAILGVAVFLSENWRAISRRVVIWGLLLQWGFAIFVLRVPAGITAMKKAGEAVESILSCALAGAEFVFGAGLTAANGPVGFVFAFRLLPTVIFVAALFAVLYHLGIMQWVVRIIAVVMARLMGISGAESLNVVASLFLGQTEAPLTIRPYLPKLTKSELLTVMTSGMAHVSGGIMAVYIGYGVEPRHLITAVIMTAPGSVLLSKLLVPETEVPETRGHVRPAEERPDANILDAAARGTREGLQLALNIGAMLIAFLGLIALINLGLGKFGTSLQAVFGWIFAPVAYLMGVAWEDCRAVGGLLGTRTVLNEVIAFKELESLRGQMLQRSNVIASFALCGFANLSSIGIQLGGIGALIPERRHELALLGFRALLAGTLANFLSACIAGIIL